MMKYFFCAICIILFSCKKQSPAVQDAWNCVSPETIDSSAIVSKLAGTWKLIAVGGGNVAGPRPAQVIEDVEVTFTSNSIYVVKSEPLTAGSGNWRLSIVNGPWSSLECTPANMYLRGSMSFCEDKVLFSNSYFDGPDYLFKKQK